MSGFEKWFVDQDFYTNMRFIYGENLFHKDLGAYRILPVQMTFKAWSQQQAIIDDLKAKLSEVQRVIDVYEDGDIDSLSDFARYVKQALRGVND